MKTTQTLPLAMMLSGVIAGEEFPSMPGMKGEGMSAPAKSPPSTAMGGMGGGMGANCPPAVPVTVTEPVYITVTECPVAPPPGGPTPPPPAGGESPPPPSGGESPPPPSGGESPPPPSGGESSPPAPEETAPSTTPEEPIVPPPPSEPSETPVGPPAVPVAAGNKATWSLGALVMAGAVALAL
ncbi:uncharacterized protein B0J16DRAFT_397024 [Fusarium flagelliforme]|uniref:uncharacterized protein n=1 Tax=Fusarium flagelliforme TaxID=2675880 RepID=UPI001E8E9DAD|nr:uncharacterized protein B0J16DRAFT_397024 [Fusarium flagelliforme]KAH7188987.1 hypothetical protein B0J16DRAFT_397024 [Fusarium flagelliforme]